MFRATQSTSILGTTIMPMTFDPARFEASLKQIIKSVPRENVGLIRAQWGDERSAKVCRVLWRAISTLVHLADEMDPVRPPSGRIELFAPATIGRLIGEELVRVARQPLEGLGNFYGSGVYALYYSGPFAAYAPITATDCPIYVGVAHPKDRHAKSPREQGRSLNSRLFHHRKNIRAANASISISDFHFRYLVTESGWQGTAEEFLIWLYRPVWNKEMKVCSGFGKHGDQARKELSAWDVLHGGRKWAGQQTSRKQRTVESVSGDILKHYAGLLRADPALWSAQLNPSWVRSMGSGTGSAST